MKKFNVKVLSMAVTAAVASGAAGAAEQNFAAAVGGKDDQGQAAFFTVFGEGTTYDKGTGKLTFKKDSDALLLKTLELEQTINGFASGSNFITTDANGNKTVREATNEDVEADEFKGLGLKEVVAAHDEALGDLTETVNENSEALVKTAEVVNAISADVNANKAAIETKADKTDFEELAKYTADMGKKVNDIGDEVTSLSDATTTAVARIDEDIVNLKKAGLTAADALEANRQDIDANKAAIAENTASLKEQEKANEGFNNAIASLDEDISTLKKVGLAAADALEVNRQDIDANKAAIDKKADKADFEELAKYTADMGKKVNDIGDEVTALSDATSAAITRHDKDIVDLAQAGLKATEALEANRKDIDANKAAIAENTAKLEEQKEANEGFNNAIASLDEDIITLKKADLAAADALKAHRTDIDANKAAIETKADKTAVESVRTIAVEAQKSAQVAKGAVEVTQKSAETADSHAKAAQTAAAKAQESADTNAVQIAANTKQIDTNKTDIAALQTANGQHAAGIAKNSARIDSLDKNVANLRKETRQGLAAQAALSGLFQPYSVGKFNVTAALGGFKSDTAVAVGAGYRFNENFAAKAGLAVGTSSGGSASYNVGLNYEW